MQQKVLTKWLEFWRYEDVITKKHWLIYFSLAPLGMHSIKRRHQSPERTILSHVNCFIQGEVIGFQVLMDSLHPRSRRASWWSPPVLQREAVKILASVLSGAFAQCFVLFWFHLELPSWILDLDRTHWALAFVCFSFVFLYILCFWSQVPD